MTPALKAMVEAMSQEIARQYNSGEASTWIQENATPEAPLLVEIDSVNLEKVARAGLARLKDVVIDAPEAEGVTVYGEPIGGAADTVFCLTVDAILKDPPAA